VKAKTKELLYLLLWACQTVSRPTFRNLTESFEGWAYRTGLHRQLLTLEKQQLLESRNDSSGGRVHRLTSAGCLIALGGRDPQAWWSRRWDGKWRMVIFDVPQTQASARARLRRSLASRGFGYLQDSVWITPDPLASERQSLGRDEVDVESLILLEAQPCAGETDGDIVGGAWDFRAINERYDRCEQLLSAMPKEPLVDAPAARRLQEWFRKERLAWSEAIELDPLLPECLHPSGYRGMKAWKQRLGIMADAARLMKSFAQNGPNESLSRTRR